MSEYAGGTADSVPGVRLRPLNEAAERADGEYVLYWMTAFRRLDWNFALQRAVERARELDRPLVILEPLRVGYPWASRRIHTFVIEGMADHHDRLADARALYYPYVEPQAGAGSGLLEALAERACLVVGDDFPAFFLPRMHAAAAEKLDVRLEAVDSNGLLPLRATERAWSRAYDLRRHLHRALREPLSAFPRAHPLTGAPLAELPALPDEIVGEWPPVGAEDLADPSGLVSELPVEAEPGPVPFRGGPVAAGEALDRFLDDRLADYAEERNEPAADVGSGLSPHLHFGHLSVHEVFARLAEREGWAPEDLGSPTGKRQGWWGMSESAESFLDELVTWRELGLLAAVHEEGYERFESLPDWARETLDEHAGDERDPVYELSDFEAAETHDELWNAAQRQLLREGRIHNYLRMLWGKKILHWSESPEAAYEIMEELNNKYAIDGRDPNSYTGILWVLGKYDRPWGPERPIFGKVRYMTSDNTARKFDVKPYLERWSA